MKVCTAKERSSADAPLGRRRRKRHLAAERTGRAQFDAPFVDALEGFIDSTNSRVTGSVTVKLEGGHCRPVSRESEYAVYSKAAASFDQEDVQGGITQQDATGVAKYHGFQSRLANDILADAKQGKAVPDGNGEADDATEE